MKEKRGHRPEPAKCQDLVCNGRVVSTRGTARHGHDNKALLSPMKQRLSFSQGAPPKRKNKTARAQCSGLGFTTFHNCLCTVTTASAPGETALSTTFNPFMTGRLILVTLSRPHQEPRRPLVAPQPCMLRRGQQMVLEEL